MRNACKISEAVLCFVSGSPLRNDEKSITYDFPKIVRKYDSQGPHVFQYQEFTGMVKSSCCTPAETALLVC